jgi:hypothetical protein
MSQMDPGPALPRCPLNVWIAPKGATERTLENWRSIFDEVRETPAVIPKVGLMKLRPLVPDKHRYSTLTLVITAMARCIRRASATNLVRDEVQVLFGREGCRAHDAVLSALRKSGISLFLASEAGQHWRSRNPYRF